MIRFCDGVVYQIEQTVYTREKLLINILDNHLQNIIFQVVNRDNVVIGTVQYRDILGKNCTLEECIQKEKIYFNENVFENVRSLIVNNKGGVDWFCSF